MTTDFSRREYVRPKELEEMFGIKDSYLRALQKRDPEAAPRVRRLPGARGVVLYRVADLREWIEQHEQ